MAPASCLRRARAMALALALGCVYCCGGGTPEPVAIVLDEDACDRCRMAISERRYAAQLVTREGRIERFDDLGCLAARIRERGRPEGAGAYVAAYRGGAWLAAETAAYVVSPALPTPMGYGLAAFADRAAAEAAASELGGEAVSWQQVLADAGEGGGR